MKKICIKIVSDELVENAARLGLLVPFKNFLAAKRRLPAFWNVIDHRRNIHSSKEFFFKLTSQLKNEKFLNILECHGKRLIFLLLTYFREKVLHLFLYPTNPVPPPSPTSKM